MLRLILLAFKAKLKGRVCKCVCVFLNAPGSVLQNWPAIPIKVSIFPMLQ